MTETWDSRLARAKACADAIIEELQEIRRRQSADLYMDLIGLRLDEPSMEGVVEWW